MDTNIQNKVKDLLDKFRSGAISSEEFKELSAKINQSSEADLEFLFSDEWDKFNSYEPLSQDKINSLYRKLNKQRHITPFMKVQKYWLQIAASILLILSCGISVLYYTQHKDIEYLAQQNITINSGEHGTSLVTLPDGTLVHLNAKSYIERTTLTADLMAGKIDVGLKLFTLEDVIPELEYRILEESHLAVIMN